MTKEEKKLVHYSFECKVIKRKGVVREEENKAIEMLDKFITEHKLYNIKQSDGLEDNIKIALNLIAKREEEIEKYKETEQKIKDKINDYKTRTKYIADIYNPIYLEIAKDFEELLEEE